MAVSQAASVHERNPIPNEERLIVALDSRTVDEARRLAERLWQTVSFFKVGLTLQFHEHGMDFVGELIKNGKKVFLDSKVYDVPEQARGAVSNIVRMGVSFLTIHGDSAIVKAAVDERNIANSCLKLFAVTVLTSLDEQDLHEMGYTCSVEQMVLYRAKTALNAGCDGVICSGLEAPSVRSCVADQLLIVTPGIRSSGSSRDDQKRVVTPEQALRSGADYIVMGREIARAADPADAAKRIREVVESVCG